VIPVAQLWQRSAQGSLVLLVATLAFSKALGEITSSLLICWWLWGGRVWWPTRRWWAQWRTVPITPALATFLGVCVLSIVMSTFPELSWRGFVRKTLEYACLCWAVSTLMRGRPLWKGWWWGTLLGSLAVVFDVVWQVLTGADLRGHSFRAYGLITGPFENPNDLATYLMLTMPILIGGVPSLPRRPRWLRPGVWLLIVALGLLAVATFSVAGWLGLLVAGLVLLWGFTGRMRWVRWSLLGGAAVFLLASTSWLVRHHTNGAAVLGLGFQDRLVMWQAAWDMWRDRFWFGHGLNTFMAQYLAYWTGGEYMPRYAHNCYLQMGAEVGFLGLAAFLWVLGVIIYTGLRGMRSQPHDGQRFLSLGLLAAVTAFLVQAALDTNFYSLRAAMYFWTVAGLLVGLSPTWGIASHATAE